MLNFGIEPGLKYEILACGPSVRSRRRGLFWAQEGGCMRHKGTRHQPGSAHGPRGSQGPLGIPPGHPRRCLRFDTFF